MKKYALVSATEAGRTPYPYVWMHEDGTVRELHANERRYLETAFEPTDGGRPYTKRNAASRDGWGNRAGFLQRSHLPLGTLTLDAPAEDPNPPMTPERLVEFLRSRAPEARIITRADGAMVIQGQKRGRSPGIIDRISKWFRDGAS